MNITRRLSRLSLLIILTITFITGACAGPDTEAGHKSTTSSSEQRRENRSNPPTSSAAQPGVMVARADHEVAVHPAPGDDTVSQTLPAFTEFGSARALVVTATEDDWVQVLLPVRPNGSTGWMRRADVELRRVTLELRIDLEARTLTLIDAGSTVLTTAVAIGAPDAPTPTGLFSVTDKLVTENDGGAYGPYALGLSGHSDVLTEFAGGDGQIGIHGTNDPDSIGQAESHGCIRVPNHVITQLNEILPLGTPVVIT